MGYKSKYLKLRNSVRGNYDIDESVYLDSFELFGTVF